MKTITEQTAKITSNPIGAIAGGVAGFYGAKKFGKVTNVWVLTGLTVVGVIVGAAVQSAMKAKASTPKPADVKK